MLSAANSIDAEIFLFRRCYIVNILEAYKRAQQKTGTYDRDYFFWIYQPSKFETAKIEIWYLIVSAYS